MVTRSLRVGAAAIACALIVRLGAGSRSLTSFLIYLETGRTVRFSPSSEDYFPTLPESAAPVFATLPETRPETQLPPEPEVTLPSYAGELSVYNTSGKTADTARLLAQPLRWDLANGEKTVLIMHTHATESYTKRGEDYVESASWRTLNEGYNMLSVGDRVTQLLEQAGIGVVHDRELHDYPSYNGSYAHARAALEQLLTEYPTIRLVLDLHRDAADMGYGQLRTLAQTQGKDCAQLMVVIGGGHAGYEENLALGLKLTAQLERQTPGITRELLMRSTTFNQDLCPGAVLVEVGAAGNSHDEAMLAADQLAQAILALSGGAN